MSAILAVPIWKRPSLVVAARDITVSVPAQQTVGVIGANGAGKTTFINMITPSDAHKVRHLVRGKEITASRRARSQARYLPLIPRWRRSSHADRVRQYVHCRGHRS